MARIKDAEVQMPPRMSARIVGFNRTSLLDWDGCVAATIYLQGCNLRCGYCHNPQLLPMTSDLEEVPLQLVLDYVTEHRDFVDGVVVTGGEPTIHADLFSLLKQLRATGVKTKLDTNGTNPEMLEDLLGAGMLDFVAMDVKAPLDERYAKLTGVEVDLEALRRSIALLKKGNVDYEFRTTIVPFYIQEKEVSDIAVAIEGAKKYALHQFRKGHSVDSRLSVLDPYPDDRIRLMADIAKKHVRRVVIRGEV
jgi:pyruvate formate lyase activating enzyme